LGREEAGRKVRLFCLPPQNHAFVEGKHRAAGRAGLPGPQGLPAQAQGNQFPANQTSTDTGSSINL
jgi:hypothetical protein